MVETIVNLKPQDWWPKRKYGFNDALQQAAVVAAQAQRLGWLRTDGDLTPEEWVDVARAVRDAEFAQRNPRLSRYAELLNTVASVVVEQFDRAMRDVAHRRQVEYEPELIDQLTGLVFDDLMSHARSLPAHPTVRRARARA